MKRFVSYFVFLAAILWFAPQAIAQQACTKVIQNGTVKNGTPVTWIAPCLLGQAGGSKGSSITNGLPMLLDLGVMGPLGILDAPTTGAYHQSLLHWSGSNFVLSLNSFGGAGSPLPYFQINNGPLIPLAGGSGSGTINLGAGPQIAQYMTGGLNNTLDPITISGDATLLQGGNLTLNTVNSNPGSTGCSNITTTATGLVTSNTTGSCGGGGSTVTWPASNSLVVSNGTDTPSHLSPVNNDIIYATGGAWSALASANNAILCTSGAGVPSLCSTTTIQILLGYITGNQPITLSGDTTAAAGATALTTMTVKVNGVAYPGSPSTNTVPVVTSSNNVSYYNAASLAGVPGFGTMLTQNASAVAITGGTITGLGSPMNASDAATKGYVDANVGGQAPHTPVAVATAAVLPNSPTYSNGSSGVGATLTAGSNVALVVDGTTISVTTTRVLVYQQAAGLQNGIYTLTQAGTGSVPWILTRATDFDQAVTGEVATGATVFVTGGSTLASTAWSLANSGAISIGSTALSFVQVGGATTYTADESTIHKSGTQFSALPSGILNAITSTTNQLLYNTNGTTWGGITAVNSAVLATNGSGVPSEVTTLPSGLTIPGATHSGTTTLGGTLTGTGLSSYLASPPAIGGTAAGAISATTLNVSGTPTLSGLSSGTCNNNLVLDSSNHVVTASCPVIAVDTVTTGIAAAGTTLAAATAVSSQQNYVASGTTCTAYPACAGQAGVKPGSGLMVQGQHFFIINEDANNALVAYPVDASSTIDGLSAGTPVFIPASTTIEFIVKTGGSPAATRTVP